MKITAEWLQKRDACPDGIDWFVAQNEPDGLQIVKKLISGNKLDWANWLITRIMSYQQYVGYAVFAAENVIDIYEKKYPGDNRPRNAIEAAKKCITNPSAENKMAADAAWAEDAAGAAARDAMKTKILKYGITLLEEK